MKRVLTWYVGPKLVGYFALASGVAMFVTGMVFTVESRHIEPFCVGGLGFLASYASACVLVNTPDAVRSAFVSAIVSNAMDGGCTKCKSVYVRYNNDDNFTAGIIVWHTPECVEGQRMETREQDRELL